MHAVTCCLNDIKVNLRMWSFLLDTKHCADKEKYVLLSLPTYYDSSFLAGKSFICSDTHNHTMFIQEHTLMQHTSPVTKSVILLMVLFL